MRKMNVAPRGLFSRRSFARMARPAAQGLRPDDGPLSQPDRQGRGRGKGDVARAAAQLGIGHHGRALLDLMDIFLTKSKDNRQRLIHRLLVDERTPQPQISFCRTGPIGCWRFDGPEASAPRGWRACSGRRSESCPYIAQAGCDERARSCRSLKYRLLAPGALAQRHRESYCPSWERPARWGPPAMAELAKHPARENQKLPIPALTVNLECRFRREPPEPEERPARGRAGRRDCTGYRDRSGFGRTELAAVSERQASARLRLERRLSMDQLVEARQVRQAARDQRFSPNELIYTAVWRKLHELSERAA